MATIQIKRFRFEADIPSTGLHPGEFLLSLDTENLYLCKTITEKILVNGNQTKSEVLTGAVDGINRVFTTSLPYMSGKIEVFLNGLKEIYFVETSDRTITLDEAPKNIGFTDRIEATYTLKP